MMFLELPTYSLIKKERFLRKYHKMRLKRPVDFSTIVMVMAMVMVPRTPSESMDEYNKW